MVKIAASQDTHAQLIDYKACRPQASSKDEAAQLLVRQQQAVDSHQQIFSARP